MSGGAPAGRPNARAADLAARRRARLQTLPAVDQVLRALDGTPESRARQVEAVRAVLAEGRRAVLAAATLDALETIALDPATVVTAVRTRLAAATAWQLDRVVNATGVVLHTNLGRAPLGPTALARIALVAARYSNLELDVRTKARGTR